MSDDVREHLLKIVVCGDGSSGKTSLCLRFAHDAFDTSYHQTLGLDFFSRRLILPGDNPVMLQVWDVGGQSIASSMIEKYVSGADAVLIVYDVTNASSFENVQEWASTVKKMFKTAEKIPTMVLVGNKVDLDGKRVIKIERHSNMAAENDMLAHFASARTGDSVNVMFLQVAAACLGIPISKNELEKDITPQVAEATTTIDNTRRKLVSGNSTSVCSLM